MAGRSRPGRRIVTVLLSFVALVCLVAGSVLLIDGLTRGQGGGAPMPQETFDLAADEVPDPADGPERPQTPEASLPDNRLHIPAIGASADLVTLGLSDEGRLQLPTEVSEVTIWSGSAAMDASDGSILIAGHVDDANQGAGALFSMHTLRPGDAVYVTAGGVDTRWKVTGLQAVVKEALPERVFHGPGGRRQLFLVTCGGPIITDSQGRATYRENVILTAVPF